MQINVTKRSSFADYLIIATGTSVRHVVSLGQNLASDLKKEGIETYLEGVRSTGNWVVLDMGDIVVHLFTQEERDYYGLETMWLKK